MKKTYLLIRILKPDLLSAKKVLFVLALYMVGVNTVFSQGPNCEDFISGIDYDGNSFFYVHEFLTNEPELPIRLTIRNNGQEIVHESQHYNFDDIISFNICPYLQDSLSYRVENNVSYCESKIHVGIPPKPYMSGSRTTVFCNDPIVNNRQPIDSIYPVVTYACGVEPDVVFSSDWVDKYDCEDYSNDTLKVIYREFEGFDKYKRRFATQDTIIVLKVPEITEGQFICAENDTLYCGKADDFGPKFFYENPITGENDTISMVDVTIGDDKILDFTSTSYLEDCGVQYSVKSELIDNTKCEKRYRVEVEFSQNCYYEVPELMRRNKGLTSLGKGKYRCVFWALDRDTLAPSILIEDLVIKNLTTTHNCEAPIEFPNIKIEDKWAGVRHAKADVDGEFTIELKKEGQFWKPVEERFLPVGGQIYEHFADKLMSDFENAMDRNFSDDYRKYTDPISCIPFSLVGNNKAKLSLNEEPCTKSLSVNNYGGAEPVALEVPLRPRAPDNSVIRVAVDVFTDSSFTLRGYNMYNKWVHHDTIIEQPLDCGRVRRIYEFSDSVEYVRMSSFNGDFTIDNFNYSITTTIEHAYKVYVEGKDSCNLMARDSFYIVVKDKTEPTIACDKDIVVGLTGKLTWVDAEIFDEGSYDNCGIYKILGRRKNWATSCGVNLCDGLETDKRINPVEAHYAEYIDWLKYDGEPCSELLYKQWQLDSAYYCPETDEHGNVLQGKKPKIGGGWTEKIPFCCEDACGEVDVELLVVDYWCNYSICWTTVKVEDKQSLSVVQDVESEFTISCASYAENYKEIVENAMVYNRKDFENSERDEAFKALDEVFGGYDEVWKNIDGYLVDENGENVVPSEYTTTVSDIRCENYSKKEKIAVYNEHTGKYDWIEEYIPAVKKEETEKEIRNGILAVNCSVDVYQDVWVDLDECGTGTIRRRFFIVSGCNGFSSGSGKKLRDTVYREQKIVIDQDCELSLGMFKLPTREISKDVCDFTKDQLGNYSGDLHPDETGWPEFTWNQSCKSLEISYEDKLFNLVGSNQKADFKLIRTWEVSDWCGTSSEGHSNSKGKKLEYEQKIIITEVEECNNAPGPYTITGKISNTAMQPMSDVSLRFDLEGSSVKAGQTNEMGNFEINFEEAGKITVVPEKKSEMSQGITTLDMVLIHQHIINKNKLSGRYEKIAADINQNGQVDVMDVYQLRHMLLNPEMPFPFTTGYRFFESDSGMEYGVADFGASSSFNMNFTGVTMGDVNFSSASSKDNSRGRDLLVSDREESALILDIEDRPLKPGKLHKIPVTAGNYNEILGLQFELNWDQGLVSSLNLIPGVLSLSDEHYSSRKGNNLSVSWSDARGARINKGDILFTVEVQLNKEVTVKNWMEVGNKMLAPESYIEPGVVQNLVFNFIPSEPKYNTGTIQNAPNPFSDQTIVSFDLNEEEKVNFTIFNMAGKTILNKVIDGGSGINAETVYGDDLPAAGIYFYELKSSSVNEVKKMIYIKR